MRTIISGPVLTETVLTAALWGINTTSFVTNGLVQPPLIKGEKLPTTEYPICPKFGDPGAAERARNYTLVQNADALILVGQNDHLVALAETYELPIFQDT